MKTEPYAHQQLAATGFVILDAEIAFQLRPDLWPTIEQCGMEFAKSRAKLERLKAGLLRFTATLDLREIEVATHSDDLLLERMGWLGIPATGLTEIVPPAPPKPEPAPPRNGPGREGDLYVGECTEEPGRTCTSCVLLSSGGVCLSPDSGVKRPVLSDLRRCLSYAPPFGTLDDRGGVDLWPELVK